MKGKKITNLSSKIQDLHSHLSYQFLGLLFLSPNPGVYSKKNILPASKYLHHLNRDFHTHSLNVTDESLLAIIKNLHLLFGS
jgi:hypothetical protein